MPPQRSLLFETQVKRSNHAVYFRAVVNQADYTPDIENNRCIMTLKLIKKKLES